MKDTLPLIVRNALPEDAAAIANIHVETWQHAYKGLIPDAYLSTLSILDRTRTWQDMLADEGSGNRFLVAEMDGKIVGWCSLCKSRDEDAKTLCGEVGGIYVHPTAQKQGAGKALLQQGLKILIEMGFTQATLWVLTSNQSAIDFYESQGWINDKKTKIDARDGFELHETRFRRSL